MFVSRSLFLKLGGEEVEYDPGFQLYLQTKLSNPHYKPEIAAQVNHACFPLDLNLPWHGLLCLSLLSWNDVAGGCTVDMQYPPCFVRDCIPKYEYSLHSPCDCICDGLEVIIYKRAVFLCCTRLPCQCTLINFIATEKGLEDQLLAKVVGVERPELEKQAQELQSAFNQVR